MQVMLQNPEEKFFNKNHNPKFRQIFDENKSFEKTTKNAIKSSAQVRQHLSQSLAMADFVFISFHRTLTGC